MEAQQGQSELPIESINYNSRITIRNQRINACSKPRIAAHQLPLSTYSSQVTDRSSPYQAACLKTG